MKKFIAVILCGAMTVGLAACGSATGTASASSDGDTITIGVFEPKTGENGGDGLAI